MSCCSETALVFISSKILCWEVLSPNNFSEFSREQWFLRSSEKAHASPVSALPNSIIRAKNEALTPWGIHFDIYRWMCAVWIILLFLLQRETCASDTEVRKMQKNRRRTEEQLFPSKHKSSSVSFSLKLLKWGLLNGQKEGDNIVCSSGDFFQRCCKNRQKENSVSRTQ